MVLLYTCEAQKVPIKYVENAIEYVHFPVDEEKLNGYLNTELIYPPLRQET